MPQHRTFLFLDCIDTCFRKSRLYCVFRKYLIGLVIDFFWIFLLDLGFYFFFFLDKFLVLCLFFFFLFKNEGDLFCLAALVTDI